MNCKMELQNELGMEKKTETVTERMRTGAKEEYGRKQNSLETSS